MMVEKLLQLLVGEVDAELLKAVVLPFLHLHVRGRATRRTEGGRRRDIERREGGRGRNKNKIISETNVCD